MGCNHTRFVHSGKKGIEFECAQCGKSEQHCIEQSKLSKESDNMSELFAESIDDVKAKYNLLLSIAKSMRHQQKEYFRTKGQTSLYQAKKYESQLDKFIEQNAP